MADLTPPEGFTSEPVSEIGIELTEEVAGDDARSVATYELLDLGPDRAIGGGDDLLLDVTPSYVDGTTQITLAIDVGPLPDGVYRLTAKSGDPGLRALDARYLDGDGNGVGGDDFVATFVVDTVSPLVGDLVARPGVISATVTDDVALNEDSLTDAANYVLLASGGDGSFDDGNEIDRSAFISGVSFNSIVDLVTLDVDDLPFEDEQYRLIISDLEDLAGNSIVETTLDFHAHDTRMSPRIWRSTFDGDWETAANWYGDTVPTAGEDVLIDKSWVTVSISSDVNVAALQSDGSLKVAAGSLTVTADSTVDGDLTVGIGQRLRVTGSDVSFQANGLTTIDGATLVADEDATLILPNATSLISGNIFVGISGSLEADNLADIDGTTLSAGDGGSVSLPAVTSYTVPEVSYLQVSFEAYGDGSVLELPNLTEISGSGQAFTFLDIRASDGGSIDLGELEQIAGPSGGSGNPRGVRVYAEGEDSVIDLTGLDRFSNDAPNSESRLAITDMGAIFFNPVMTTLSNIAAEFSEDGWFVAETIRIEDGTVLTGEGRFWGNLINDAVVRPGSGSEVFKIEDDYTQTANGVLIFEIAGPDPGNDFRPLEVVGQATLDGVVEIRMEDGYLPGSGDVLEVMSFASRSGEFSGYLGLDPGGGTLLAPALTDTALSLVAGFASGPAVTGVSPSDVSVDFDRAFVDFTFNEPIDAGSLTVDDVLITGPSGPVEIDPPLAVAGVENTYRVYLASLQGVQATYEITIGPNVLDVAGNPMNQDADGLNGETIEDAFVGSFDLSTPDLVPQAPQVDAAADLGDVIDVSWNVQNTGPIAATGDWTDRIWLSDDTVLDAGDLLLGSAGVGADSPLAASDDYSRTLPVTLPSVLELAEGVYYVILRTDADAAQVEGDEANNEIASGPITLSVPPLPDLQVTDVTIPAAGHPGEQVSIGWTVENLGDANAAAAWIDRVYLSSDGNLAGATLLGARAQSDDVPFGESYPGAIEVALPAMPDGDYHVLVVTDATSTLFEGLNEANNQGAAAGQLQVRHADLTPTILSSPASAESGATVTVQWSTANHGTTATPAAWFDRVYLSTDAVYSAGDLFLGEVAHAGPLPFGQGVPGEITAELPIDVSGDWYFVVVSDADGQILETDGEADNQAAAAVNVSLAPYADLAVTDVIAPAMVIGDPGELTVTWIVKNQGTGSGFTDQWTDAVILSTNATVGDGDDLVLGRFEHSGGLDATVSYSRTETIALPPGLTGRFHLFAVADVDATVFENGLEANNAAESGDPLDVMPVAYADLVVSQVTVPGTVESGLPLDVSWTVENRGIGVTNTGNWIDRVYLATDPAGVDRIELLGEFEHFGHLGPDTGYDRSVELSLPKGLEGTFYLVVVTGGPFEFIFTDNNDAVSSAVSVVVPPLPDLAVTSVVAPTVAEEGTLIDVTWTVENVGTGEVDASWVDVVYLEKVGDPAADPIQLGQYRYTEPLSPGIFYTRSEAVRVPGHVNDLYRVVVTANPEGELFENGLTANNTAAAADSLAVSQKPRPDLQIAAVTAPATVDPGGTFSVTFEVSNQGPVATTQPHWTDRVYLSLDNKLTQDDLLIGELGNAAALLHGESYISTTDSFEVPKRFRGDVFVLVIADADEEMDEWPHEANNTFAHALYVEPAPLADLVTEQVVVPSQAVEGAQIEVRYTVTNRGSGPTDNDQWIDTIWLTIDKNRPHPGHGDILLGSFMHTGALDKDAGYDAVVTVELPAGIRSGSYYITPWTDPYGAVLEDTLAVNVNPDDPNEIDNNNYKARAIDILGGSDLVVTSVAPVPASGQAAFGGEEFTVNWTVENQGPGTALPGGWVDRVYLSSGPDPSVPGTRSMILAEVTHEDPLLSNQSYAESVTVNLSPSAAGQYVVVITDGKVADAPDVPYMVDELDETNNRLAADTSVTAVPADLVVTDVVLPEVNYSGEKIVIRYTVTNVGDYPVWEGTAYWRDFLWISADETFDRMRSSYLGAVFQPHDGPLGPGESYEVAVEATLPKGTGGDYYLHIHLDAHNDQLPRYMPYTSRMLDTGWWPADTGRNSSWLGEFDHWAFEDPRNNLHSSPFSITYREADLQVTDLIVPAGADSGSTVPITFTVTNMGNRDTRQSSWSDRLFLSTDASLDGRDLYLGGHGRGGVLAIGQSYTATVDVRLPDGIDGDFYVLAYTDSAADVDRFHKGPDSSIGFGLPGVLFQKDSPLEPWDLASAASRSMARGSVPEYQYEGNNITEAAISVDLINPPDLQVTSLVAPTRVLRAGTVDLSYTVTNLGGDTPSTQSSWDDLVYLSRDQFLDLNADHYLGYVEYSGGLAAGGSYAVNTSASIPGNLLGSYYVFVVTDPIRKTAIGSVFEHLNERNNDRASDQPLVIELPPPTDIEVTAVVVPSSGTTGEPVAIEWTVKNQSGEPATGTWSDAVYLSSDATWDISDRPMGRVEFSGTLAPGETYTSILDTILPAATPGSYRAVVRTDIFNQVYEDQNEQNNATSSADTIDVSAEEIFLDTPYQTTLSTGQERLFELHVPLGATLRVTLGSSSDDAANELFLRAGEAPTTSAYDASYRGGLSADQTAIIPSTTAGVYYVLVRGFAEPAPDTPVTLLAELMPLSITDVQTDTGGDSAYVTTTIEGAQFHADAIVKLVRPGFAEYEPARYEVLDGTRIVAVFDLSGAPHGLYDLKVINPNGDEAIVPYRFQVARAIESEVTIGIGGPRAILAGDAGTYSVALQGIGNLDAPYTFFQIGVPEMGTNEWVYELPYLDFFTNVRGGPTAGDAADLPWASLDSAVNTDGNNTSSGYLFDLPTDGFTGFTFNVLTYPGLRELHDRAWEEFRDRIYAAMPRYAELGILDDGPAGLDLISPGLSDIYAALGAIPDLMRIPRIPFQFHVTASATAMTRDEFIAHSLREAATLREAIIQDDDAPVGLVTLAADQASWGQLYLAALEDGGLLRAEGDVPPIREHPAIVSLMGTLAGGILLGPAGTEILSTGNLVDFFDTLRNWYGNDDELLADTDGLNSHLNPVPTLSEYADYDLGLSQPTHFQTFRIYVPWVPFEDRGAGLPPDFQISGAELTGGDEFVPLDLSGNFQGEGAISGSASLVGPFTAESGGFLPMGQALPYTVHFQNDPAASSHVGEVRVVTQLDADLDVKSFRLGGIQIGDIQVSIPQGRSLFSGDFDFTEAKGFILRVSAGIDQPSRTATWLVQAIDPLTGEVLQDADQGLLPPNNALGRGAGFVSYTILPDDEVPDRYRNHRIGSSALQYGTAGGHADADSGRRRRRSGDGTDRYRDVLHRQQLPDRVERDGRLRRVGRLSRHALRGR